MWFELILVSNTIKGKAYFMRNKKNQKRSGRKDTNQTLRKDINSVGKRLDKFIVRMNGFQDEMYEFKDEMYKFRDKTEARFDRVDHNINKLAELMMRSEERTNKRFNALEKIVVDGVARIEMLYENSKSDFKFVTKGHEGLSVRVEDHEKRIGKLEDII